MSENYELYFEGFRFIKYLEALLRLDQKYAAVAFAD